MVKLHPEGFPAEAWCKTIGQESGEESGLFGQDAQLAVKEQS